MRTVMWWAGVSVGLLLIGLAIHAMPSSRQGAALTLCLVLASGALMVKIAKG